MKVCVAQIRIDDGKKEDNLKRVIQYIHKASRIGCELVVFPECVLGGFKDTPLIAEPLDGEFMNTLKMLSNELDIAIAGTFAERDLDKIYDTAFFVYNNKIYTYRKRILFKPSGEDKIFGAGSKEPEVFEYKSRKIGMLICYEVRFPELVLPMLSRGLELLILPAAWMSPRRVSDREALIPARAVESQSYVIAANRVGGKFFGRSIIAGPSGEVYKSGRNEGIYAIEIFKERIEETRKKIPAVEERIKNSEQAL